MTDCLVLGWKKSWIYPLCLSLLLFLCVYLTDTFFTCIFSEGSHRLVNGHLPLWLINQSMSWPARHVTVVHSAPPPQQNISVPNASLFDFDAINLNVQTQALAFHLLGYTFSSTLIFRQSSVISLRVWGGGECSRIASRTSLCLVNLRASDFHWERKSKENLKTHLLLTSASFSLYLTWSH